MKPAARLLSLALLLALPTIYRWFEKNSTSR
jgi:hypothetical protein